MKKNLNTEFGLPFLSAPAIGGLERRQSKRQLLPSSTLRWRKRLLGLNSAAACLALMIGAVSGQDAYAQSRLFSWTSGDAVVREWSGSTGGYMSNVLTLVKGSGEPFTDQSDIEFDGVFFYSIAENDPIIRQYDITGRHVRDFARLVDNVGNPATSQVGFASDGKCLYTIARNSPTIRKYDLAARYIGDAGQLRDLSGPVTSQVSLATDGQFFYTIAAGDYRIRRFDLTGQFLADVVGFNRGGTPEGNNTGIALFPPLPRYTNGTENLITNGSFEVPALLGGALWVPAKVLSPWQTTEDSFEVWSDHEGGGSADGWQSIEILAQSASTTVWQTVPTIPGEDYTLTFSHTPRPGVTSSLTVAANSQVLGTYAENGSALSAFKWVKSRLNFTAFSNRTTIAFTDTATGASGTHLDNVVLQRLPLQTAIRVSEVEVCWESVGGKQYQVQYRPNAAAETWRDWGAPMDGTGTTMCITDAVLAGEPRRFYRVITVP